MGGCPEPTVCGMPGAHWATLSQTAPLLSKPALPGSGRAKYSFVPCPGPPRVLLHTMQILAVLNADVGLHVVSTACCIYCELTGQGLPLADLICAIKPTEGSLAGDVPVSIRGRVAEGRAVFFLARHLLHVRLPPRVPLATP